MEFELKHEGTSLVIKDLRSCTIEEGFAVSSKPGSTLREYLRKIYIRLDAQDAERVKEFSSRLIGKTVDVSIAGIHVGSPRLNSLLEAGFLELNIGSPVVFEKVRGVLRKFDSENKSDE